MDKLEIADNSLMEGEQVDSALKLAGDPGVMLLTGKRIVHIQGNGKNRKTEFVSIQDVDAVETGMEREGNGVYVWAALSFVVAVLLYFVINNATGQVVAPAVVGLLGLYLIADHLIAPGISLIVFKAGSSHIRCELPADHDSTEVYGFINRLFQMKMESSLDGIGRRGRYAPR